MVEVIQEAVGCAQCVGQGRRQVRQNPHSVTGFPQLVDPENHPRVERIPEADLVLHHLRDQRLAELLASGAADARPVFGGRHASVVGQAVQPECSQELFFRQIALRRRAGDFLGGHIVSGHVDGVGKIRRLGHAGADRVVEVECGQDILRGLVPKGSIALCGISLTVVDLTPDAFTVHIIPHTWANTSLRAARAGDAVNLETDIIGKYVARHLAAHSPATLTLDQLRAAGFAD